MPALRVTAPEMEFCLLGPLQVRRAGQLVPLRHAKLRALLAALLLRAGRPVLAAELAETLWWPGDPPPSAAVTIRNYVKRLPQALGDADRVRISTQPGGYQIRVDDGELDVTRFEALAGSAQTAARDREWDTAASWARAGLALWRGDPLADVPSDLLTARELPRLADLRLRAPPAAPHNSPPTPRPRTAPRTQPAPAPPTPRPARTPPRPAPRTPSA